MAGGAGVTGRAPCGFPGCGGSVEDGYCGTCGRAPRPVVAVAAPASVGGAEVAAADVGRARDPAGPTGGAPTPGPPAPPAHAPMPDPPPRPASGGPCAFAGCGGTVDGGYCERCGRAPRTAAPRARRPVPRPKLRPGTASVPSRLSGGRPAPRSGSGPVGSRRTGGTRLGLGLVDVPPVP